MVVAPPPGLPFHRLARTARHAWWRPPAGLAAAAAAWAVAAVLLFVGVAVVALITGRPDGPDGVPSFGPLADLALGFVLVALLLPVTLAAARWVQRRPAGSLSSVLGRLRWRWLALCLVPAAGALTVTLGVGTLLPVGSADTGGWAGWGPFLLGLAVLALVVPAQAAAEEYACRGYLLQAAGAFLRRPWFPVLLQAVLFAALHGWGTPWGFADLVVFGVLTGVLTVRTGGLEAAIALHVVNNFAAGGVAVALGLLTMDETAADLPWQMVAVDVPVLIAYTLVVLWLARRRRIAVVSAAGPDQPALAGERAVRYPVTQVLDGGLAGTGAGSPRPASRAADEDRSLSPGRLHRVHRGHTVGTIGDRESPASRFLGGTRA